MFKHKPDYITVGVITLVVITLLIPFSYNHKKWITYIPVICSAVALILTIIKNEYEKDKELVIREMSYRVLCYHALDVLGKIKIVDSTTNNSLDNHVSEYISSVLKKSMSLSKKQISQFDEVSKICRDYIFNRNEKNLDTV